MEEPARETTGSPFQATGVSVSLTANDLSTTVAWYQDAVGFEVSQEFMRDGRAFAVRMRSGSVDILVTQDDGAEGVGRVKGQGFSLRLTTRQNVDDIAARITAHGSELEAAPFDAWGARAFRVRDPNGFLLVISSEPQERA